MFNESCALQYVNFKPYYTLSADLVKPDSIPVPFCLAVEIVFEAGRPFSRRFISKLWASNGQNGLERFCRGVSVSATAARIKPKRTSRPEPVEQGFLPAPVRGWPGHLLGMTATRR